MIPKGIIREIFLLVRGVSILKVQQVISYPVQNSKVKKLLNLFSLKIFSILMEDQFCYHAFVIFYEIDLCIYYR